MTRLSVNINKFATLRNARGGSIPNVIQLAKDIEIFGGQGITVHPRPDGRHIRYDDVRELKSVIETELNVEGNPIPAFLDLVLEVIPDQVTLVPDAEDVLTSNAGWDTINNLNFLREVIIELKKHNIRTSIFLDPNPKLVDTAAQTAADRIELYTESFAREFSINPKKSIIAFQKTAELAIKKGLEVNAGHDLNLDNIEYFNRNIPHLKEVSIGHALICESLYFGLENTIQMYLRKLSL